jgi:hypothetical protein
MTSTQIPAIRYLRRAMGLDHPPQTKDEDILRLIHKLQPRNCGIELVRIGGACDGGYLVPDDFEGIEYCFSPGVNTCSEFESQLADRYNIKSFLADYSVEAPPIVRPEFTFDKKFLGACDRAHYITLPSWKDKYIKDYGGDLLLEMDIEGSEYEVILNTPDHLLNQFRIMIVEFHDLHKLFDPFAFRLFSTCFEKVLELFHVAHIHPNNHCLPVKKGDVVIPKLLEITFLNKRRVTSTTPQTDFPHKLDVDNAPGGMHLVLPKCWYASIQ